MIARDLRPAKLSLARTEEFVSHRRADAFRQAPCRRGRLLLMEHLIAEHVVAVETAVRTALDDVIEDYHECLINDAGWPRQPCCATRTPTAASCRTEPAAVPLSRTPRN